MEDGVGDIVLMLSITADKFPWLDSSFGSALKLADVL